MDSYYTNEFIHILSFFTTTVRNTGLNSFVYFIGVYAQENHSLTEQEAVQASDTLRQRQHFVLKNLMNAARL